MSPQPWDQPADGAVTRYGFRWGPMLVTRLAHVEGRGYAIQIETPHQSMQVYISEKGRKIAPMEPRVSPVPHSDFASGEREHDRRTDG